VCRHFGGRLLTKITGRATTQTIPMSGDAILTRIGGFQPLAGKSWSENVGALGNAARACYRVVNNNLLFTNVGDQVHTLAESMRVSTARIQRRAHRLAVNDVTVCGRKSLRPM